MRVVGVQAASLVVRPAGEVVPAADFDDFYRRHWVQVWRVAAAITGDLETGAEVAQEAFLTTRDRWRTVADLDRPDLWVRRVAVNRARSIRRRTGAELRSLGRLSRLRPARGADAASLGDADLWAEVRRLPHRQRAVVALHLVDDLPLDEVAALLSISPSTAKTHLARAKATLAERLTKGPTDV